MSQAERPVPVFCRSAVKQVGAQTLLLPLREKLRDHLEDCNGKNVWTWSDVVKAVKCTFLWIFTNRLMVQHVSKFVFKTQLILVDLLTESSGLGFDLGLNSTNNNNNTEYKNDTANKKVLSFTLTSKRNLTSSSGSAAVVRGAVRVKGETGSNYFVSFVVGVLREVQVCHLCYCGVKPYLYTVCGWDTGETLVRHLLATALQSFTKVRAEKHFFFSPWQSVIICKAVMWATCTDVWQRFIYIV